MQHNMNVKPSTRNCGEVSALPMSGLIAGAAGVAALAGAALAGGRRTNIAAGIITTQASTPM